jgi:hypothetical protein
MSNSEELSDGVFIQAPVPVGQRLPSKEGIILKFFVDLKISVERNYAAAQ